ncbi:MAG: hypothetical protein HUJ94_05975 [Bacteroidales bacterium]|nr:hypothetical protein [Bacteroidales bacterium]
MKQLTIPVSAAALAAFLLVSSCATQKKLSRLQTGEAPNAGLNLSDEVNYLPEIEAKKAIKDTLTIKDEEGNEYLIMKAVRDDESGEMVATEVIDAAVVTARFRNISEHHGKVDLAFDIVVPETMQDSRWQLRFYPDMFILDDSLRLDPVVITGQTYRKAQLKGYQQYEKFLSRIVSDTTRFIDLDQLELFLQRNMPEIYSFKTDSTIVSDEDFQTCYGISQQDAIDHYTNKFAVSLNNRRKSMVGDKYRKYVKAPIVSEGIRLDTVMVDPQGAFVYKYIQTINTRPRLRRVDIVLSGDIWEQDKKLYEIPSTSPLTFYISSLSAFADNTERYITKVIERRVEANTACYVDFAVGKSEVDLELSNNREEIGRIQNNLSELIRNTSYDLDSIVVVSFASPEGKVAANNKLSKLRSESIAAYMSRYMKDFQDSLAFEYGMHIDESGKVSRYEAREIPFISRSMGENWQMLDMLVIRDTILTEGMKSRYSEVTDTEDLDVRESMLQKEGFYNHLRTMLYPRLRTTRFDFYLHRKGMVKDTVNTTVLDSVYMAGVQALRDMDYNIALRLLAPYKDFNSAVAYVALDRNLSALEILEPMKRTAEVNYLLAVLYSRMNDAQKAVQCYLDACNQNSAFIFRGNLDPEISALIKAYGLNRQEEDEGL